MNKTNHSHGFSLVELMIAVAIISILATVAITSFQKYILESKITEGLLQLRELHDRQIIFASTPLSVRDSTYGDVQCRSNYRFATTCMQVDNGDGLGFGFYIPSMVKAKSRRWYGRNIDSYSTNYNPSTGLCSGNGIHNFTDPKFLFFGAEYTTTGNDRFAWIDSDKGYFTVWSWHNQRLAQALPGVNRRETTMIWAIADLDGDFVNASLTGNQSICNDDPRDFSNNITILGRSIYYSNGELHSGAEVLRINPGE